MFVLVNKLNYTNGCLSSIFYVAAAVLVAQDAHVGSKLNAAAFVIGPLWFGAVLAGIAVSLQIAMALSRFSTSSCYHLLIDTKTCIAMERSIWHE